MNKIIVTLLLVTQYAYAQDNASHYRDCPYDSTKRDWSVLDRLYLISQLIDPRSVVYPRPDTMLFNIPFSFVGNDTSGLAYRRNVSYDALLYGAFKKDSMAYKIIAMELCALPWDCYKYYYYSNKQVFEKLTFERKLSVMTMSFWLPTIAIFNENFDNTRTIILNHQVDTALAGFSPFDVRTFSKYADFVIGDIVYKSDPAIRRKYKKLQHIFYCGDKLLAQSVYNLDGPDFPKLYSYSFWESVEKNYGL